MAASYDTDKIRSIIDKPNEELTDLDILALLPGAFMMEFMFLSDHIERVWHLGDGHGGAVAEAITDALRTLGFDLPAGKIISNLDNRSRCWKIAERDGYICHYCGAKLGLGHSDVRPPHADHVMPRSRGGRDAKSNLVASCQTCNLAKRARTPEEWLGAPCCPIHSDVALGVQS